MRKVFQINNLTDIKTKRKESQQDKNDDLLGVIESVNYALEQDILTLPVNITMPDPPDAIIECNNNRLIAVEVRRITWKRLKHIESKAVPWSLDQSGKTLKGDIIELSQDICVDDPARSEDFLVIKKIGEKLDGKGFKKNDIENLILTALHAAVTEKQAKFQNYSKSTNHVWLFLIADALVSAWQGILSSPDFMEQVKKICSSSDFERILLFRDCHGVKELYEKTK